MSLFILTNFDAQKYLEVFFSLASCQTNMSVLELSRDCLNHICSFLDDLSLVNFSQCSKDIHSMTKKTVDVQCHFIRTKFKDGDMKSCFMRAVLSRNVSYMKLFYGFKECRDAPFMQNIVYYALRNRDSKLIEETLKIDVNYNYSFGIALINNCRNDGNRYLFPGTNAIEYLEHLYLSRDIDGMIEHANLGVDIIEWITNLNDILVSFKNFMTLHTSFKSTISPYGHALFPKGFGTNETFYSFSRQWDVRIQLPDDLISVLDPCLYYEQITKKMTNCCSGNLELLLTIISTHEKIVKMIHDNIHSVSISARIYYQDVIDFDYLGFIMGWGAVYNCKDIVDLMIRFGCRSWALGLHLCHLHCNPYFTEFFREKIRNEVPKREYKEFIRKLL